MSVDQTEGPQEMPAQPAVAAKKTRAPAPVTFLKKLQIVAGFDMDIEKGTRAPVDYDGLFVLGSHISGATKKQIETFFAEEGISNRGTGTIVKLSAEDYYKLEAKYTVPLQKAEIEQMVKRFGTPDHRVDFMNSNSAFGLNYTRAIKLLRDYHIPAACQLLEVKISAGDQSDRPLISLTDSAYEKLAVSLPAILAGEKEKKIAYDQGVAARSAPVKAAV